MLIKVKGICAKWHFSSCAIESVWPQHWGSGVIYTNCVQNDLKTGFLSGYLSRENAWDLELGVVPSSLMLFKNTLLIKEQVPSAHPETVHRRAWLGSTCEEDRPPHTQHADGKPTSLAGIEQDWLGKKRELKKFKVPLKSQRIALQMGFQRAEGKHFTKENAAGKV